jgi:hypothetical protein
MSKIVVRPVNVNSSLFEYRIKDTWDYGSHRVRFTMLNKKEDGNYEPHFILVDCRSYMGEATFQLKALKNFPKEHIFHKDSTGYQFEKDYNYLEGNTIIGINISTASHKEYFESRFNELNKIEEKFNIPLSTYSFATHKTVDDFIVVEGSPMWKDSCWKIQLYTYMLKTLCYSEDDIPENDFYKLMKKNYKNLFGNISMNPEDEIFDLSVYGNDTYRRHIMTGFVSICKGNNSPMSKLLGISK